MDKCGIVDTIQLSIQASICNGLNNHFISVNMSDPNKLNQKSNWVWFIILQTKWEKKMRDLPFGKCQTNGASATKQVKNNFWSISSETSTFFYEFIQNLCLKLRILILIVDYSKHMKASMGCSTSNFSCIAYLVSICLEERVGWYLKCKTP